MSEPMLLRLPAMPLTAWYDGIAGSTRVFDITFVLVLVFTALQAPSLPWFARRLDVLTDTAAGELTVDAAPLDEMNALIMDVAVPVGSRLAGEYVADLRLPRGAMITLVVREGESMVPSGTTRLRVGDRLLVVTTAAARSTAERRLRAVSRWGALAGWFGEDGAPD